MVYYQDDNKDKETLSITTTGNASWTDYTYKVDVKFIEGNTKKDDGGALLIFRYQSGNNYYIIWMKENLDLIELHNHGDGVHIITTTPCILIPDTWYHINITIVGQIVNLYIDDIPYFINMNINEALNYGSVALGTNYYKVMFDNIYVDN